jgi:serine/threonine protein phosphatase PrpC
MASETENRGWRVIGSSVRGASHTRTGLPNQDAAGWLQKAGSSRALIVAVSDGHGSAKCFRSHIGSRLAIESAIALAQEFINGQPDLNNLSAIKRTAEERLPQELSRRWREAVEAHIESNPITAEELDALEKIDGITARETISNKPTYAYGATILTVVIMESFILYLQLGDGDILLVSNRGDVERPLPKDERLFANETTSLISQSAWSEFRFGFQTLVGPPPALILLSTDGYANSFVNEEAFIKVGADLLEMIRADGLDKVDESLEAWLTEATQTGSGDDTTLALICRTSALKISDEDSPVDESLTVNEVSPVNEIPPVEKSSSAEAEATGNAAETAGGAQKEATSDDATRTEPTPTDEPTLTESLPAQQQVVAPGEEKQ